jgi:hypothetical protein
MPWRCWNYARRQLVIPRRFEAELEQCCLVSVTVPVWEVERLSDFVLLLEHGVPNIRKEVSVSLRLLSRWRAAT